MFPERGVILLDNLAIRPECQKQGLRRRLLHYAEQRVLRRCSRKIRLYTNEAMTENIDYYKRAGSNKLLVEPSMASDACSFEKCIY